MRYFPKIKIEKYDDLGGKLLLFCGGCGDFENLLKLL
jgi:hypothetical protein